MDEPLVPITVVVVGKVVVRIAAIHVSQELSVEGSRECIATGPRSSGPKQFRFTYEGVDIYGLVSKSYCPGGDDLVLFLK